MVNNSVPTGYISLEMPNKEVYYRMVCQQGFDNSLISNNAIKTDELVQEEYIKILERVKHLPLHLYDIPCNLKKLRKVIYDMVLKGCKIVAIDYLTLLKFSGKGNLTDQIGEVTKELKNLSKEFNIAIICLMQLSRKVEERTQEGCVPCLADIRSSGDIEQDADAVFFVYRPKYYVDQGKISEGFVREQLLMEVDEVAIICAKNRSGDIQTNNCRFEGRYYKFYE
jgi:replicative DNA helicase